MLLTSQQDQNSSSLWNQGENRKANVPLTTHMGCLGKRTLGLRALKGFDYKFRPFLGGPKDLETLYLCPFQSIGGPYFTHSIGRRAKKEKEKKKMKKRMLVTMVSVLFVLSMVSAVLAQQQAPAGPPPVVKEMVAKAKGAIQKVTAADVKAAIDKKEKAIFLDVRDPGEFAAGHLPEAINISRGTLEFVVFNKITDQNAKIYVYCKTTGRSAFATKTLGDLGYKNALLMDAQFEDWIKAGYPVVR
jgi:rhodanese-related sulfurtransferase